MDNLKGMKYFLELMELERIFEFNGYSKKTNNKYRRFI